MTDRYEVSEGGLGVACSMVRRSCDSDLMVMISSKVVVLALVAGELVLELGITVPQLEDLMAEDWGSSGYA